MREFLIKAKIKEVAEGRSDKIEKHIFAADEEIALDKFKLIFDKPENLNWEQIEFESIEEITTKEG